MEIKTLNTESSKDKNSPMVSVIITCYNYEKFIQTSIESVLNQNYPHIELIVVDDCSKDNSRALIMEYQDQLIPAFHEENKGHGGAFNTGYDTSSGDIVMFLDADDYLLPNSIEDALAQFPAQSGMCQYRMHLVDDQGSQFDIFPKKELHFDEGNKAKEKLLHCGQYQSTVTSGLLFKREYLDQVMPIPQESFRQGGDGYLVTLAPIFTTVSSSEYCLSAYRQHGLNHSAFSCQLTDRAKWLLDHNKMRHSALMNASKNKSLPLKNEFWFNDMVHLNQIMCLALFEPNNSFASTSRLKIVTKAMNSIKSQNLSTINRLILSMWWISISFSPRVIAKPLYSWRLLASSRPKFVQQASTFLRRL
ncbi:glycosyltransferase family 2 protein [Vibrio sp. YMD68]|uniref:glycosyltransferase family 2 protein n=1 Tax=Vibrio sp. YMD68 TaxID=3042300 RepID=UPI00249CEBA8|nr:glycosyltransferase family 2 protein [Vibrio sp. YMD68]WGV98439.1 glycosyltransferase family 2 protein [Vibrio sp. YMD68]